MKSRRLCELCEGEAAVYCEPDSAFLCWTCDAAVHGANFLVARHVRRIACAQCWSLDAGRLISGAGSPPIRSICRSCDPDLVSSPSSSSSTSSSCLSSAESSVAPAREEEKKFRRRRPSGRRRRRRMREEVDERAERILASWSRRMGLTEGQRCVGEAAHVLGACPGVAAALPFRVALAAALWFAAKLSEVAEGTGGAALEAVLRRLEACSGVPAKLIVLAEARLARAAGRIRVAEEGWAECS
ncbi:B-box zinc finger protein 32-like [Phoenix dactylifera]|uniref:B-box zinc finger protein 32-like n=1 Tax=Phoenix dactylifera TaxID=42345 RepID=A0A8B7MT79_PHODC|nr:B-box zinc finger protein 32-like [Phoenix dactylifera]XP_038984732.1 B-box zinc finger protein 32-like [Phoenix dactylifera]